MHPTKRFYIFPPMHARFGGISLFFFGTVILFQLLCATKVSGTKMHYIHWNTSNPLFRIDNTDHIIDVNKGNIRFEYDQVNIICPGYNGDTRGDETEKYIIYNVSKEEYDTCRITNISPRIIAVCDKPNKLMYFTITFRPFSPQPGGLEFRPGQDYYFISTSSKDDLYRKIGGRCNTHHMKVVFKVCCDPSSQPAHDQANGHLPTNGLSTPRSGTSTILSTTKLITSLPTTKRPRTTTTVSTTTKFSTTSSRTTSRRIPSTRTQINKGRKPYADAKSSVDKKKALKNEMTRSDSICFVADFQIIIPLTFVSLVRHFVPL